MDRLEGIALFNKVVEVGSFSEAGRQSNLSPSSVSRSVVELEDWVGATLLHRTTRRLRLTEVGRVFHERSKGILLDLEEARVTAGQLENVPAGLLRVSMPASLEQHLVVAASLFQERWPEVSFSLVSSDRPVDLVAEGFDMVVRSGTLDDSSLRARKIVEVKRTLCASPHYLKAAPALNHPRDVENHDCLILGRARSHRNWLFSSGKDEFEVRATGRFMANSGNMLVSAARRGRGLVLSPDWIVGPYLANGELTEALPGFAPSPAASTLYAIHPFQRFVPPHVRMFIDFLIAHFSADYDWGTLP
ncbi:hypothetical protein ABI59_17010 [Acidobacteria bacterium Mor1]|nr:hypothetical protein ABI59_17010 [Acidobacteria bacterium Mor1]